MAPVVEACGLLDLSMEDEEGVRSSESRGRKEGKNEGTSSSGIVSDTVKEWKRAEIRHEAGVKKKGKGDDSIRGAGVSRAEDGAEGGVAIRHNLALGDRANMTLGTGRSGKVEAQAGIAGDPTGPVRKTAGSRAAPISARRAQAQADGAQASNPNQHSLQPVLSTSTLTHPMVRLDEPAKFSSELLARRMHEVASQRDAPTQHTLLHPSLVCNASYIYIFWLSMYVSIYSLACMYVCMYACIYMYIYICMYVCARAYVYECI